MSVTALCIFRHNGISRTLSTPFPLANFSTQTKTVTFTQSSHHYVSTDVTFRSLCLVYCGRCNLLIGTNLHTLSSLRIQVSGKNGLEIRYSSSDIYVGVHATGVTLLHGYNVLHACGDLCPTPRMWISTTGYQFNPGDFYEMVMDLPETYLNDYDKFEKTQRKSEARLDFLLLPEYVVPVYDYCSTSPDNPIRSPDPPVHTVSPHPHLTTRDNNGSHSHTTPKWTFRATNRLRSFRQTEHHHHKDFSSRRRVT